MLFDPWVWQCALLFVSLNYRWFCWLMFIKVNHFCAPGSKALDYSNGMFDCQSPTSPFMGSLRALHLLEELRSVLEVMDTEERESLRCQIPDSTAESLGGWIHGHLVRCEAVCRSTSWFLVSPSPTFYPFCICWVNPSWALGSLSVSRPACCEKHADFLGTTAVFSQSDGTSAR